MSWKYWYACTAIFFVTFASFAASVTGYSLHHQCVSTSHFWKVKFECKNDPGLNDVNLNYGEQCRGKVKKLRQEYLKIKDKHNETGKGRTT